MSISILGGVAKGAKLATPSSHNTRPTSVLLKRRLFDSHQSFEGIEFYDICTGSGSMGIEAMSRGAEKVIFVESNQKALGIAKKNCQELKKKYPLEAETQFIKSDAIKFLKQMQEGEGEKVLFFDPPYESKDLYIALGELLRERPKLFTKIIVEFCRQKTAPEKEVQEWLGKPDKSYRQGTSFLYIYDLN